MASGPLDGLADGRGLSQVRDVAVQLERLTGFEIYPDSVSARSGLVYALGRDDTEKSLCLVYGSERPPHAWAEFQGEVVDGSLGIQKVRAMVCPRSHHNAHALRQHMTYTSPVLIGLARSVGLGDRLGLATPGHVRAVRASGLAVFLAQQSIREMSRTGRSPADVMDDATWGVFQEGYRDGFGSDADHLKTTDDIDVCVDAGFTLYTIDPGAHVDDAADSDSPDTLADTFDALPWSDLETRAADLRGAYLGRAFRISDDLSVELSEEQLVRAAVKYGRAIAHTTRMYRHLASRMGDRPFELEMSVDETATPTSVAEHFFVASQLKRLGVEWVSLAPRFIGEFEKGVDYKGDLQAFEQSFAQHAAVARHMGPYKLSLHSGSDKFSVYPIAARVAGDLVHVKTAGTSYLEALRAIAGIDPGLFREILAFAIERYDEDKASYHVSADPAKVRRPEQLGHDELASVLDQFDGRQVLHVTYGSVLTLAGPDGSTVFRDRLLQALRKDEDAHYAALERHLGRHVAPFCT